MKTRSMSLLGPALLLALFAAGGLAGIVFTLPVPATLVGLALVALGLRIGVMFSAAAEPAEPGRPVGPGADAHEPALRPAGF